MELDTITRATAPAIAWELERRLAGGAVTKLGQLKIGDRVIQGDDGDGEADDGPIGERTAVKERMWPALRRAVWEMFGLQQTAAPGAGTDAGLSDHRARR